MAPRSKRRRADFVRQAVKEAIRRQEYEQIEAAYRTQPDIDEADDWSNAEAWVRGQSANCQAGAANGTTTAGAVVTLNEARIAAGTRTPASYVVRQAELKTQQQVVGGVAGSSVDAATKAQQEAARKQVEEEKRRPQ